MTYQTELQRLVGAKASMRASIIAKGVDVPESAKIEDYPDYIAQIVVDETPITPPDLSKVLDAEALANIQNIIYQGKAQEYFSLGDELLVTYGGYTMPFEVVGFEPVEVEGGNTVPALNLLTKYTLQDTSQWGASDDTKYSASTLRTNITTTYQNRFDANFVACLASTKVQTYSRDGSTDVVYDKLFAPSMAQLGVTDTSYNNAQQAAVEGPAFTAYQGAANTKRTKGSIDDTLNMKVYWTRSMHPTSTSSFGAIIKTGAPGYDTYNKYITTLAACNFIGKDSGGGGDDTLWNPDAPTLEGLKYAIDNDIDVAVGTEIPDTWNGNDNPLIVAQKLDSSNNSSYGGAEGIICIRKYPEPFNQKFSPSVTGDGWDYRTSTIKTLLDGEYYNNCTDELKAIISEIKIPYYVTSVLSITCKWFLMSTYEVCATATGAGNEGIMWDYWKQKTGLTSPNSAANDGRKVLQRGSESGSVLWLRTRSSSNVHEILSSGAISNTYPNSTMGVLPACFIAKGGN